MVDVITCANFGVDKLKDIRGSNFGISHWNG